MTLPSFQFIVPLRAFFSLALCVSICEVGLSGSSMGWSSQSQLVQTDKGYSSQVCTQDCWTQKARGSQSLRGFQASVLVRRPRGRPGKCSAAPVSSISQQPAGRGAAQEGQHQPHHA